MILSTTNSFFSNYSIPWYTLRDFSNIKNIFGTKITRVLYSVLENERGQEEGEQIVTTICRPEIVRESLTPCNSSSPSAHVPEKPAPNHLFRQPAHSEPPLRSSSPADPLDLVFPQPPNNQHASAPLATAPAQRAQCRQDN